MHTSDESINKVCVYIRIEVFLVAVVVFSNVAEDLYLGMLKWKYILMFI